MEKNFEASWKLKKQSLTGDMLGKRGRREKGGRQEPPEVSVLNNKVNGDASSQDGNSLEST